MTVINTNTAATLTANALSSNQRAMNQTMERLSTGSRINSASDDAAGLTQVSKMDAQIRGTNMAIRNTQEAINMIQTADGAAIEIDSMLQRMRELAVQSRNSSNTAADLTNLNKEFAQLATEIDRVANTTEYNDTKVLDASAGTTGSFNFHIDANTDNGVTGVADAKVSVNFGDFNMNGGTAVAGVQTMTMSTANLQSGAGANDSYLVELTSGQTMVITVAEIATVANSGAGDATDITNAEFVAAFNTVNDATSGASMADITASAPSSDVITFTEVDKGLGQIAEIYRVNGDGVKTAITKTVGLAVTTAGATAGGAGVLGADLSSYKVAGTIAQADATIAALDTAIAGVAAQRATFGATINRFEYTIDNLSNVSQNTVASRSRIEDADYAAETTELARTQIIAQAATAMLSQANQQAQSVLALLK